MNALLAVLLLIAGLASADDGPLVETPLGKVRGHTLTSRSGRQYMAFTGVPFAKPPVGELRFQPPHPPDLWRGIREAKDYGASCIQHNIWYNSTEATAEDCLYLDAYTRNVSRKVPVLVMFHGGGFSFGSKTMLMPTYLMDEDIVVVQANYRLGMFGFLTFETKELAGNQGLKDQWMALRWVKRNIGSFGGDPDKVTITGFSAGGASVYHHIVSPLSRGLFQRAISTSGASYNPWALSPPGLARENAEKLMSLIGCPTEPEEAIPCALEKDAQMIVDMLPKFLNDKFEPILIFSPSLEEPGSGGFLEAPVSKWEHNPVPLVSILSSAEALIITAGFLEPNALKDYISKFSENAPIALNYWASASQVDVVTKKIQEFYFPGKKEITMNDFANLTNMYSDAIFNHGVLKAANKHKGDVYFWWFDYAPPGIPNNELNLGANHAGELIYMWDSKLPGLDVKPFQEEKYVKISKTIVKMVAQFMENGAPNILGTDLTWKKWTSKDQNFLHLDSTGRYSLKKGLLQDRFDFWDTLNFQDKFDLYEYDTIRS